MTVAFPFPQEKYKNALMLQEKSTQSYWYRYQLENTLAGSNPSWQMYLGCFNAMFISYQASRSPVAAPEYGWNRADFDNYSHESMPSIPVEAGLQGG